MADKCITVTKYFVFTVVEPLDSDHAQVSPHYSLLQILLLH